jgi:hypothetical protein
MAEALKPRRLGKNTQNMVPLQGPQHGGLHPYFSPVCPVARSYDLNMQFDLEALHFFDVRSEPGEPVSGSHSWRCGAEDL